MPQTISAILAGQLQRVRGHLSAGQLGDAGRDRHERLQRHPVDGLELAGELERRPLVERCDVDADAHAADALAAPDVRAEGAQQAPVGERIDSELLARLAQGGRPAATSRPAPSDRPAALRGPTTDPRDAGRGGRAARRRRAGRRARRPRWRRPRARATAARRVPPRAPRAWETAAVARLASMALIASGATVPGGALAPEGLRAEALTARSRALGSCEPCQIRKEAALSDLAQAPRSGLARVAVRPAADRRTRLPGRSLMTS